MATDLQAKMLLAMIFPTRKERILTRMYTILYNLGDVVYRHPHDRGVPENQLLFRIGDRLNDLEMFLRSRRVRRQ